MRKIPCLIILPALVFCLTMTMTMTAFANQGQAIYKWTEEDGSITYGQMPPANKEAVIVERESRPSSSGQPATPPQTDVTEPDNSQAASSEPETIRADDEEAIAVACSDTLENIAVLENPAIRQIRAGGGDSRILEPEERQSRLEESRAFVEQWC